MTLKNSFISSTDRCFPQTASKTEAGNLRRGSIFDPHLHSCQLMSLKVFHMVAFHKYILNQKNINKIHENKTEN